MKKHYFNFLLLFVASLLFFNQSCSVAQKGTVTSKTASLSNGYTVMNPGEAIIIYKYEHVGHSAKEADKNAPKYYFTTASSDVLTVLNKTNLKNAFPTNHPFHDAIDANFTKDEELINYDGFHKVYKINRLLLNDSHSNSMHSDNSNQMNRDSSNKKNWDNSNKNWDSSNKDWDSSNKNRDSSNHKNWDSSHHKNWDSSHHMNKDNSNFMNMDSSMMSAMNTSMGKMHNMKMSADFDHDFAHMMILHHQAAIDMSEIVMAKGKDAQVKKMAQNIITEQKAEIAQLELFIKNHKVTEGEKHYQLGKSMNSMMEKMNSMKMTGNIDKDYVIMMIPHHESAVRMAEAELAHGKQTELKKIAQNIISDQKKEIAELNSWKNIQK